MRWRELALLGALAGCAAEPAVDVPSWELAGARVELPAHLEAHVPDGARSYRLRARVALPEELRDRPLTFTVAAAQARMALRADGREAVALDESVVDGYRASGEHAWRVEPPAGARELLLELEVAHRWALSAWIDAVPRLSATGRGDRAYLAVRAWNTWSTGGAFAVASLLAVLYLAALLTDRRRTAEGWFAAVTAVAAFACAFMLGLTQPILGSADGAIALVVISGGIVASVHFVHAQFELAKPPRLWLAGLAAVVLLVLVLRDPFRVPRWGAPLAGLFWLVAIGHHIRLLVRLRRRSPPPRHAVTLQLCWTAIAVAVVLWLLPWLGAGAWLGGVNPVPAAFTFFSLVQSIALGRDRAAALERAGQLTAELEQRLAELERQDAALAARHDDLRVRIAQRSGRLAHALGTAADPDPTQPAIAGDAATEPAPRRG